LPLPLDPRTQPEGTLPMRRFDYVIEFFSAQNPHDLGDCYGFFASEIEAIDYACDEIARVVAMPPEERDPGMDWAWSFQVRRYDNDKPDDDEGEIVVPQRGL
jgi:hypothetical protein